MTYQTNDVVSLFTNDVQYHFKIYVKMTYRRQTYLF